jgi:hypothetical protein
MSDLDNRVDMIVIFYYGIRMNGNPGKSVRFCLRHINRVVDIMYDIYLLSAGVQARVESDR